MHAFDRRPPHFHWTPGQLADAVPLRLSELLEFTTNGNDASAPANLACRRLYSAPGYLPARALAPHFRIS